MSVPTGNSITSQIVNYASGNSSGGLPVTQSAAYPPAAFVTTPAPTLPPSLADYTSTNQQANLSWIRQAFMLNTLSSNDISTQDMARRIYTTAAWKYTDTTLGGNWPINSPPQFTEFADIAMGGDRTWQNAPDRTTMTTTGSFGMGRAYSEVIDDNAQLITMSFGVQAFNSLSSFFGNFYDPQASQLVRTGRAKGLFFQAGQAAGYLLSIPFKPIVFASSVIKSALNIPSTKFSYFKPTMPLYWNAVNTILNGITANIGIHNRSLNPVQKAMYQDPNSPSQSDASTDIEADIGAMSAFLPDIYSPIAGDSKNGGYIDAYAVANRAQRLSDKFTKNLQDALDNAASMSDLQSRLLAVISGNLERPQTVYLSDVLTKYLGTPGGQVDTGNTGDSQAGTVESMEADSSPSSSGNGSNTSSSNSGGTSGATGTPTNQANNATGTNTSTTGQAVSNNTPGTGTGSSPGSSTTNTSLSGKISGWWNDFWQSLKSDLADGSNYITFRTEYGGSIGESFSNSMKESDIQQKINSMSSDARSTEFNFAGGNIVGGIAGDIFGKVMGAATDLLSGVAAGFHLSGIAALAGAAYVDIPRMYDSSTVNLPNQTFTIELRSWSGHKLALLQNIYFPLACLLAGVMPRSTGAASWNSPFSCQLFAKGRMQIRNGLITDMSITRGTGNVAWTAEELPLGIDVTFTVTDFSSMMYMPIIATSGFVDLGIMALGQAGGSAVNAVNNALTGDNNSSNAAQAEGENIAAALTSGPYSDDSIFSDYLAVLAGLDWKDQVYPMRKWSIARDKAVLSYETFKSPHHAAGWVNGTMIGQAISGLVHGTDRP